MAKTVLNIAAGKLSPIFDGPLKDQNIFLMNLDPMYYNGYVGATIEALHEHWDGSDQVFFCNEEANQFMERTIMTFDHVCIYRYLEHVSFTDVNYFIYLLSTITEQGAELDIIVPNYELLAEMIIADNPEDPNFEANNILLTTELLNEPSCPHASIWTVPRAYHFLELEGRFEVTEVQDQFEFDGRDIYMRIRAKRK